MIQYTLSFSVGLVILPLEACQHFSPRRIVVDASNVLFAAPWGGKVRSKGKSKEQTLAELREENDWKNDLILFWLPPAVRLATTLEL